MARARNIKPALFKNEVLGVADPMLTLLFEGLWLLADREGRLEDRPLRIKGEIFPYRDGINVEDLLSWLEQNGFIDRYTNDGHAYIQVLNFKKHQNPHKNEAPSEIPEKTICCTDSVKIEKSTDKIGIAPADSLIPDSLNLIPDSLIPASTDAELFDKFWRMYPNKKGKANAEKAWAKIKVTAGLFTLISDGLARQVVCADWKKDGGAFIPHPATWLNGRRWEDEVKPDSGKTSGVHHGFDNIDYSAGLVAREDGTLGL